ncbi:MAG: hypothetical protein IPM45_09555 [Acidimicrobiales bacterium]|nr:hypothetical protein [Acidimicrobiales bacterium]
MTDVQATPLRELVEARREEIKAIVARHHGRSVAIYLWLGETSGRAATSTSWSS